jgi:hypothetical protein
MTNNKITAISSLKKIAQHTDVIALRGWDTETPFVCRVRRSSLRVMITAGKIPNPLMAAAQKLYEGQASRATASITDMLRVMERVVEDALVEPKLAEIKEAGLELTEEQFGAIFNYAQSGVKAVEPFLFKPAGDNPGQDGEAVADEAE